MKKFTSVLSGIGILILAVFIIWQIRYEKSLSNETYFTQNKKTVIKILAGQSTSDAGVEDMIDEMVAEKFPQVTLEWECVDWGESFESQMRGRLVTGDAPDVIIGKAQDVYSYATGGNLKALDINGLERIDQTVLDTVTVDGQIYGIPYNAWYQGIVYNKDLFEEYNLEVPKTLEELEEVVNTFEQNGVTPFAAHFQESWKIANMTMQFMINDIFATQPDWGDKFREGEVNFCENAIVKKCIEQNQYVLNHSWEDALTIEQYESDERFAGGEAAMYLTGLWSLQSIGQYAEAVNVGIFPYPNETGDAKLIKEINMTFMVSNTSKHQEIIGDILEELLQNEKLMQEILGFTQTYPVVNDMELSYDSSVEEDIEIYEKEGRVIDASIGNNQLKWEFQNEMGNHIKSWLKGDVTMSELLKTADRNRKESGSTISK